MKRIFAYLNDVGDSLFKLLEFKLECVQYHLVANDLIPENLDVFIIGLCQNS